MLSICFDLCDGKIITKTDNNINPLTLPVHCLNTESEFLFSALGPDCLNNTHLRSFGIGNIGRAKIQTIKMTFMIVVAFVVCWTPYYVMCLWYWIHPYSAKTVDKKIQETLFIFAVSNSCVNPLVYGCFSLKTTYHHCHCCPSICYILLRKKHLCNGSLTMCDISRSKRSFLRSTINRKEQDAHHNDGIVKVEEFNQVAAGQPTSAVWSAIFIVFKCI